MKRPSGRAALRLVLVGLMLAASLSPLSPSPSAGSEILPHNVHAQLTLRTIYRSAEQTLRHSRLIYTATIVAISSYHGQKSKTVVREWVDIVHDIGRTETQMQTSRGKLTEYRIDTPHGSFIRYPQDSKVTPASLNTCYGTGIAVSVVLGCPGPTETSTTHVQLGRYNGKPAIVLIKRGTGLAEDSSTSFVSRLYLDPRTYLPLASVATGTTKTGQAAPFSTTAVYTHRFVARSTLPARIFDPASIGYRAPENALNHPPAGFTVYWLGAQFAGTGRNPPLSLYQVETSSGGGPGYYFILSYGASSNPVASPTLFLQEYPASRNAFLRSSRGPCHPGQTISLARGKATLYGNGNGYFACAYFPGTTVFLGVSGGPGSAAAASPYNTRSGMQVLVRALQARTPTR